MSELTSGDTLKRSCDSCTTGDCATCEFTAGRRIEDKCEAHVDLIAADKTSELFREKMKAVVAVSAFFLLTFMGWIASSTYLNAEEARKVQKEHEDKVAISLKETKLQVDAIAEAASRMELSVQVLVEVSKYEQKKANEERKEIRERLEKLESLIIN